MAIHPELQSHVRRASPRQPLNIEAWTQQATQSLRAVSIASPEVVHGISESLAIPLDGHAESEATRPLNQDGVENTVRTPYHPRREPIRRDSLKRREALLKGKEGSRQRRRWENGW